MPNSETPRTSRGRWLLLGVAGLGLAVVIALIVAALGGRPATTPTAGGGPGSASPSDGTATAPGATGEPGPVAPTATAAKPGGGVGPGGGGPQGDPTRPGDGTWGVGPAPANRTVASGTYETTVPANSAGCTYLRIALNHTVIATFHASAGQHATVTIEPTDGLFNTKGCGQWQRVS